VRKPKDFRVHGKGLNSQQTQTQETLRLGLGKQTSNTGASVHPFMLGKLEHSYRTYEREI
jgi:hypothetical protein